MIIADLLLITQQNKTILKQTLLHAEVSYSARNVQRNLIPPKSAVLNAAPQDKKSVSCGSKITAVRYAKFENNLYKSLYIGKG